MILLIDNYDSFTFNLVHFLGDLGATCDVWRNDALTPAEALALEPEAIVLSPGPCTPNEAGICLDLIAAAAGQVPDPRRLPRPPGDRPGVRRRVVRAARADARQAERASRTRAATSSPACPRPFEATRYHSLIVDRDTLPETLVATAWTEDGLVMGLRHRSLPVFGVQFHPESIASQHGHDLLANFLAIARGSNQPAKAA